MEFVVDCWWLLHMAFDQQEPVGEVLESDAEQSREQHDRHGGWVEHRNENNIHDLGI